VRRHDIWRRVEHDARQAARRAPNEVWVRFEAEAATRAVPLGFRYELSDE
jgi:hypothetical protein